MKNLIARTQSKHPPCDDGCPMRNHCKRANDRCSQMSHWLNTGFIEHTWSRVPRILKAKQKANKPKRSDDADVNYKAMALSEWLDGHSSGLALKKYLAQKYPTTENTGLTTSTRV